LVPKLFDQQNIWCPSLWSAFFAICNVTWCATRIIYGSTPSQYFYYWLVWVRSGNAGDSAPIKRLATGWTARGSTSGEIEVFCTYPDRPWGPHSLLYNGYRVFPGGKAAGTWRWPPTHI
jgi:hypothetical protein